MKITKKQYLSLYLEPELVKIIDEIVKKKGTGANRNAWITEAIEYKLKVEKGFTYLWRMRKKSKQV